VAGSKNDNGKNIYYRLGGRLGELRQAALIAQGHKVVLHARNHKRAQEALDKVPGAETVVTG